MAPCFALLPEEITCLSSVYSCTCRQSPLQASSVNCQLGAGSAPSVCSHKSYILAWKHNIAGRSKGKICFVVVKCYLRSRYWARITYIYFLITFAVMSLKWLWGQQRRCAITSIVMAGGDTRMIGLKRFIAVFFGIHYKSSVYSYTPTEQVMFAQQE